MFWWGSRVIKTAVAVTLAVMLAHILKLDQELSAGILAILGMDVTIRRSWRSATARLFASLISLMVAAGIFLIAGFGPWSLGLFVLVCYPLLVRYGLRDGIVTASVIVFHLYANKTVTLSLLVNETLLLIVGLGIATIINMVYVPNAEEELVKFRNEFERQLSELFQLLSFHLRQYQAEVDRPKSDLNQFVDPINEVLEQGLNRAQQLIENTWWKDELGWQQYFQMRLQQMVHVQEMIDLVVTIPQFVPQATLFADVLEQLADDVQREYYVGETAKHLHELELLFRKMALPETRAEFEARAALFELRRELSAFLLVAERSKKRRSSGKPVRAESKQNSSV